MLILTVPPEAQAVGGPEGDWGPLLCQILLRRAETKSPGGRWDSRVVQKPRAW